eukprot:TRINITY_DN60476_c0_g2_i1.p3 TRINITY_DN60476_c0_g2~~TRINITY_DN60476_c0_g2_i1.p3  ORF type:complete len:100 (-),score=8.96 TRINITY_DN60476_c0_g2_i1:70-369(-)
MEFSNFYFQINKSLSFSLASAIKGVSTKIEVSIKVDLHFVSTIGIFSPLLKKKNFPPLKKEEVEIFFVHTLYKFYLSLCIFCIFEFSVQKVLIVFRDFN